VHITDEVDISLVKPRARKYETAGAASAAAKGELKKDAAGKTDAPTANGNLPAKGAATGPSAAK
jgi:hypothetical protein